MAHKLNLADLDARLIGAGYRQDHTEADVSETEMYRLGMLFNELDAQYGPMLPPTESQLKKAKEIHAALDNLSGVTALTHEQQKQAEKLFAQLDEIFEPRKLLSKDKQKRVEELTDEIDSILNRCELSDEKVP